MVLLVEKFNKFCSKLETRLHHHHHHHEHDEGQAYLLAFQSDVSTSLNQLLLDSKPGSEFLSLSWVQKCFELLPIMNKRFAKLAVDIDYPMSKWEGKSMEEYLNYSLCLLDLLNLISLSISHLGQTRLKLSRALSVVENSPSLAVDRLRAIQFQVKKKISSSAKEFKRPRSDSSFKEFDKETLINQALMEIKSIGLWVCGVILTVLSGDKEPYMEMRKPEGFLSYVNGLLSSLDLRIREVDMEKKGVLVNEVRELNESAGRLVIMIECGESTSETEKELQRKLEMFEKMMEKLEKEVNNIFSIVLAGRNELLDGIRQQKQ